VCIISILRLHTLKVAVETTDPTWDDEAAATWSILELNTGIVCSCMPTLKPLVTRIIPRFSTVNTVNTAPTVNRTQRLTVGSRVEVDDGGEKSISEGSERAKTFV
jgi:hypothetical protein